MRKIGLDCMVIKLRLENSEGDSTVRIVTTITANQAVTSESEEIDEFPESNSSFCKGHVS